jgi:integrase/recombinase XerD
MFLAAADHYDSSHQALAVLLGLKGLRVNEACDTNVEDLAVERGHRTLRITGKGSDRRERFNRTQPTRVRPGRG